MKKIRTDNKKHVVKIVSPERYSYIMKIGNGNFEYGEKIFENEVSVLKRNLTDLYFDLRDKNKLTTFYKEHLKDLYKSAASFITSLSAMIFRQSDMIKFNSYKKMKIILEKYENFNI